MGRRCRKGQGQLSFADEFRKILIAQRLGLAIHKRGEAPKRDELLGTELQDDGDENLSIHFSLPRSRTTSGRRLRQWIR